MKVLKVLLLLILAAFIIIQFWRIDKSNPDFDKNMDLISIENPPTEIAQMLRSTCYDCHSNQTVWPWYSNVAPISWILEQHVEDGRENINFSYWGDFEAEDKIYVLEEMIEEIELAQMPLPGYSITHSDAKLSEAQMQLLIDWLRSQQTLD